MQIQLVISNKQVAEEKMTLGHVQEAPGGEGSIRDTMGQNHARQRGNSPWDKHLLLGVRVRVRQ